MRKMLTDYLKNNYKNIEGFEELLISNNDNIYNYINKMKRQYEYGTYNEICVYSLLFKKKVIIYIIDDKGKGIGNYNIGDEYEITTYLLYISLPPESNSNNHYKLLKRKIKFIITNNNKIISLIEIKIFIQ